MSTFTIRTLRLEDAAPLLAFELANRAWFERHIEARAAQFYSPDGVRAHIQQFLDAYGNATWHPCVIVGQDGMIIGRANLKDIAQGAGSAEVGYRIAEQHAGRGLATAAVRHLVDLARSEWRLQSLVAYVKSHNIASARALERCGFTVRVGAGNGDVGAGDVFGVDRFSLHLRSDSKALPHTGMSPMQTQP